MPIQLNTSWSFNSYADETFNYIARFENPDAFFTGFKLAAHSEGTSIAIGYKNIWGQRRHVFPIRAHAVSQLAAA